MNGAILVAGAAGVGKTTFANMVYNSLIVSKYAEPVLMPMAQNIKNIARNKFGWDGEKDERGRALLQVLGTDAGRTYNSDLWVDKVLDAFVVHEDNAILPHSVLISDDIRFDNEITRVCSSPLFVCTYIIKIEGPSRVELPGNTAKHTSENSLTYKRFSVIIDNDSTLEKLQEFARLWADVVTAGIKFGRQG